MGSKAAQAYERIHSRFPSFANELMFAAGVMPHHTDLVIQGTIKRIEEVKANGNTWTEEDEKCLKELLALIASE